MYMIPYTRRSNSSMMDLFDELERSMFGESGRRTPVFSTDIRDEAPTTCSRPTCPASARRTSIWM